MVMGKPLAGPLLGAQRRSESKIVQRCTLGKGDAWEYAAS